MEPRDQAVPTKLTDAAAYVAVPAGFDPLHATDAVLDAYGFPPRPDSRRSLAPYQSWKEAVIGMRRIVPILQQVPIEHGPRQAGLGNSAATSSNWSGYVTPAPAFSYGSQSMKAVSGDWMLPVAQTAFNACSSSGNDSAVYSSTWVGIDGSGSFDVLQAGTESDAVCNQGVIGSYQGAWYEWYPNAEVRITNLQVMAGAAMYVHVWASSATVGHAYIANETAQLAVSVVFMAPPGTQLIGNSAEWIVERPTVTGTLATLTNYGQEFLTGAQAEDRAGNLYFPGLSQTAGQPPALQLEMTDNADKVISVPTLMGESSIWFTDRGSALRVPEG
jgi:hypothetical protein